MPGLLFLYDILLDGFDVTVIAKREKVLFRRWATKSKVVGVPLYVRTGWTYKYNATAPWEKHLRGNCNVLDIPDQNPLMLPVALVQSVESGQVFLATLYDLEGPVFSGPAYNKD